MVAATEAQEWTIRALQTIDLMLADLPEVAGEWEQIDELEQRSWELDWGNEMAKAERVAQYAALGLLTAEQKERYRRLEGALVEAVPTLKRLGLRLPPELLGEKAA